MHKDFEIKLSALFAAIWSVFEVSAGTFLHLAKVPFRGFFISLFAVIILVFANKFIKQKRNFLLIGLVTAAIKMMSLGGFILNPILAVIAQSLIAFVVFSLIKPELISASITGGLILLYTFTHAIIIQIIFFGFDIYKIYHSLINEFAKTVSLGEVSFLTLIIIFGLSHLIGGVLAGLAGWKLGNDVNKLVQKGISQ